jgi:hypothetical protein
VQTEQEIRSVQHHPVRRLVVLASLFVLGCVCCQVFEFSLPILNYSFVLLVMSLPLFAIHPIHQLPRIPKIAGLVVVSPLLLIEIAMLLFFVACGSPELHHYRADSCIQQEQAIQQHGYSVHLLHNCGGGATIDRWQWVEQRRRVVPGLFLIKQIDAFYGAARGELSFKGENQLFLRRHQGETPEGIEDHVYALKPDVYF